MTVQELLDKRGLVKEDIDMGTRMPAFESGPHRVWYNSLFILYLFFNKEDVFLPPVKKDINIGKLMPAFQSAHHHLWYI